LRAPTPDIAAAIALPDWLPLPVQERVLYWLKELGTEGPGRGVALPEDLDILRRLATKLEMRPVWKRLPRHAKSESALVDFLDCAWRTAMRTPPLLTAEERFTLAQLWSKEQELLRLTNPELAQYCVRERFYFDQIERDRGNTSSPLMVKYHSYNPIGRAYVRVVGQKVRELFGSSLFGTVAITASVALNQEIQWQQVRNWTKLTVRTPSAARI
jgi:hypothetical protein